MNLVKAKFIPRMAMFTEDGVAKMNISELNSAKEIGNLIGKLIAESFRSNKAVKEACLYGGYGAGKSSISNFILSGFDDSDGCEIRGQTRIQKIKTTYPKCRHIDYRMHSGNPMVWKMLPDYKIPQLDEDEFLIGEWCEFLTKDYLFDDRLAIEIISAHTLEKALAKTEYLAPFNEMQKAMLDLVNSMSRVRVMSVVGFGHGKELVDKLVESEICQKLAIN